MAGRKVFVGDPFDPEFQWRGPRPGKPEPRAISELPASERLWQALGRRFEKGQLSARRTSGDGWIGLASRRELQALVEEACGADPADLPALQAAVATLDDKTIYYLVSRPDGQDDPEGGR